MSELKRTWAEINLDNIAYNYKKIRELTAGAGFLGVVKADAYGHGAVRISKELETLGADYLAVSNLDEARELRTAGITLPILLLGHTPSELVPQLIEYGITQTVSCENKAIEYENEAAKLGKKLKVHIKLDTGMSRLGFLCSGKHFDGGIDAVMHSVTLPHIDAEGIFTHFAVSDEDGEENKLFTESQFKLFCDFISEIERRGFKFRIRHCANTGAVAKYPQTYLDMVRPGLLLYGYGKYAEELQLRPVMSLKTVINTIKYYEEGTPISYGGIYITDRRTRIGVLPIGYADGFFRCLSNRYSFMTQYGPAPVRGKICMDMCMADLTDLPEADVGDEVTVFGADNPIDDMAKLAGTIPYELTCAVSKRVPRIYFKDGKESGRELRMYI